MFVPRIGQRLFLSLALGLFLMQSVSWADVVIQHPFNSYTSTPASLSVVHLEISNSAITFSSGSPPSQTSYNSAVNAAAPNVTYFGTLDLKNNDLIVHPPTQTPADALATFKAVYDAVRSGADSGAYDMAGVSSTTVSTDAGVTGATNAKGALAMAVMLNDDGSAGNPDGSGNPIWGNPAAAIPSDLGTFDGYGASAGQTLNQYDTIVKYSFIGDLFLEGRVTQTDTAVIFGNLGTNPGNTGPLDQRWQNGDEFYSANQPINQTDYAVSFGNLSTQSQYPYTATFAQGGGAAGVAVPEPASLVTAVLGLIGGLALVSRRSRKAH